MTEPSPPLLYAPISLGELVDRVSILAIKRQRLRDPLGQRHVEAEYQLLAALMGAQGIGFDDGSYRALCAVNQALWDLEDRIRAKEREQVFDAAFIEIARGIYRLNDQRHALKRRLDVARGSALVAEKAYGDGEGP